MRLNRPVGIQPLTGLRHSAWSEVVVRGGVEPPTFRFSGVAYVKFVAGRAGVMHCRRPLLRAVGRCCCCHRCCQSYD